MNILKKLFVRACVLVALCCFSCQACSATVAQEKNSVKNGEFYLANSKDILYASRAVLPKGTEDVCEKFVELLNANKLSGNACENFVLENDLGIEGVQWKKMTIDESIEHLEKFYDFNQKRRKTDWTLEGDKKIYNSGYNNAVNHFKNNRAALYSAVFDVDNDGVLEKSYGMWGTFTQCLNISSEFLDMDNKIKNDLSLGYTGFGVNWGSFKYKGTTFFTGKDLVKSYYNSIIRKQTKPIDKRSVYLFHRDLYFDNRYKTTEVCRMKKHFSEQ